MPEGSTAFTTLRARIDRSAPDYARMTVALRLRRSSGARVLGFAKSVLPNWTIAATSGTLAAAAAAACAWLAYQRNRAFFCEINPLAGFAQTGWHRVPTPPLCRGAFCRRAPFIRGRGTYGEVAERTGEATTLAEAGSNHRRLAHYLDMRRVGLPAKVRTASAHGLVIRGAEVYGAKAFGVTLSESQQREATRRIVERGLESRARVDLRS